jgi:hypothetical protein
MLGTHSRRKGGAKGAFSVQKSTASRLLASVCTIFGVLALLALWNHWSRAGAERAAATAKRAMLHEDHVHTLQMSGDFRAHLQAEMHSYHAAASSVSQVRRQFSGLGPALFDAIEAELGGETDNLVRSTLKREVDVTLSAARKQLDALLDPMMAEMDRGASSASRALSAVQRAMTRAMEEEDALAWTSGDTSDESAKHLAEEVQRLFDDSRRYFHENEGNFVHMPEELWRHCLQLRHALDSGEHTEEEAEQIHAELAALHIEEHPGVPSPAAHKEMYGALGVGALLDDITFYARATALSVSVATLETRWKAKELSTVEVFRLLEEDPELHFFAEFMVGDDAPLMPNSLPAAAGGAVDGYAVDGAAPDGKVVA